MALVGHLATKTFTSHDVSEALPAGESSMVPTYTGPAIYDNADKFKKAVHLRDIHLEKGMHCADCHFAQDEHGNGQLYGEYGLVRLIDLIPSLASRRR